MKTIHLWVIGLMLLAQISLAQTIPFRGEIKTLEGTVPDPGGNYSLVGENPLSLDQDGSFETQIRADVKQVTLSLSGRYRNWVVVYPSGGTAPVPKDPEARVEFRIAPGEATRYSPIEASLRRISSGLAEIVQDNEAAQAATFASFRQLLDEQLVPLVAENTLAARRIDSLRTEIELMAQQDQSEIAKANTFRQVSQSLTEFLNRTLNLQQQLAQVENAFLNEQALETLNMRIYEYNEARDSLFAHAKGYEQAVGRFWGEVMEERLRQVQSLALQEIHADILFPINKAVIDRLKQSYLGKKPRLFVQPKAVRLSEEALEELDRPLRELKRTLPELLNELKTRS